MLFVKRYYVLKKYLRCVVLCLRRRVHGPFFFSQHNWQEPIPLSDTSKPSIYVRTTRLTNIQFYFLAHTLYLCVLHRSQNKQPLFLYTTLTDLVFITQVQCVYFAVRTGALNVIYVNLSLYWDVPFFQCSPVTCLHRGKSRIVSVTTARMCPAHRSFTGVQSALNCDISWRFNSYWFWHRVDWYIVCRRSYAPLMLCIQC